MATKSKKFKQLKSNKSKEEVKTPESMLRNAKEKSTFEKSRRLPTKPVTPEQILRAKKRSIAKKPSR